MARDLEWTAPVMRVGYAGRGFVYLAIAGLSLWAIWRGGQAQGTKTALATLERSGWGKAVLAAIALGLVAYALWRALDAWIDLEAYGTDGKGLVARAGMIVTGSSTWPSGWWLPRCCSRAGAVGRAGARRSRRPRAGSWSGPRAAGSWGSRAC